MLRIGDNAPAFTLSSDKGDQVSLRDFEGKHVVLFFFPKASTPG
jgi:peroxiredoxin Q/BCP